MEGCRGAGGASQGGRKWGGGCPRSRHHGAAGSVGLEGGGPAEPAWPLVPWRLLPSISWLTAHQAIGTPLGTACLNPPDACRRFRGVLRPRALAGGFRGRARALESSAVVGSDPVMRKRTAGGGGASHGGNALRGRHRRPEPRGCSAGSSCPGPAQSCGPPHTDAQPVRARGRDSRSTPSPRQRGGHGLCPRRARPGPTAHRQGPVRAQTPRSICVWGVFWSRQVERGNFCESPVSCSHSKTRTAKRACKSRVGARVTGRRQPR